MFMRVLCSYLRRLTCMHETMKRSLYGIRPSLASIETRFRHAMHSHRPATPLLRQTHAGSRILHDVFTTLSKYVNEIRPLISSLK
jgi:hypothetical protein